MDQWLPNLSESSGLHRYRSMERSSLCLRGRGAPGTLSRLFLLGFSGPKGPNDSCDQRQIWTPPPTPLKNVLNFGLHLTLLGLGLGEISGFCTSPVTITFLRLLLFLLGLIDWRFLIIFLRCLLLFVSFSLPYENSQQLDLVNSIGVEVGVRIWRLCKGPTRSVNICNHFGPESGL